jgi:hypothetical protein
MSSSQSEYVNGVINSLSTHVLTTLAHAIKGKVEEYGKMGADELVAEFHRVLQLPPLVKSVSQPGGMSMSQPGGMSMSQPGGMSMSQPGGMPMQPPNPFGGPPRPPQMNGMSQPGMPFGGPPGGPQQQPGMPFGGPPQGMQPQQGMPFGGAPGMVAAPFGSNITAKKTTSKKTEPNWSTPQVFLQGLRNGYQICAYSPIRGGDKGSVCCSQPVVNAQDPAINNNAYKFRCTAHKNTKEGAIETLVGGASQVGVAPAQFGGFSVPPQFAMQGTGLPGTQPQNVFGQGPPQGGMPFGGPPQGGMPAPPHVLGGGIPPQKPRLPIADHKGMPQGHVVGIDNNTGIGPNLKGWVVVQNPNQVTLCIGKFPAALPPGYEFPANWPEWLQPLADNEQQLAKALNIHYAFKAGQPGNISLQEATSAASAAFPQQQPMQQPGMPPNPFGAPQQQPGMPPNPFGAPQQPPQGQFQQPGGAPPSFSSQGSSVGAPPMNPFGAPPQQPGMPQPPFAGQGAGLAGSQPPQGQFQQPQPPNPFGAPQPPQGQFQQPQPPNPFGAPPQQPGSAATMPPIAGQFQQPQPPNPFGAPQPPQGQFQQPQPPAPFSNGVSMPQPPFQPSAELPPVNSLPPPPQPSVVHSPVAPPSVEQVGQSLVLPSVPEHAPQPPVLPSVPENVSPAKSEAGPVPDVVAQPPSGAPVETVSA